MSSDIIIKGFITGVAVSVPLGPMAILIIQRTVNKSFKSGFISGIGVGLADSLYAIIAGLGVGYIIGFLREHQTIIQIIGALIIFGLGFRIFRSHPLEAIRKHKRKGSNPFQCLSTAFLLTLSNPIIVLAYIAILAGTGIAFAFQKPTDTLLLMGGFFSGQITWWFILTFSLNRVRHHFSLRILWWFNKISGLAIMAIVLVSAVLVFIKGNPKI